MKRDNSKLKREDDAQTKEQKNQKKKQEQATEGRELSRRSALGKGLTALSAYALTGLLPTDTRAELSTGANRLVLQDSNMSRQANELFAEIRRDKQREREFIDNPVGLLASRLSPREYQSASRQRIANANRILYSLLSNDGFINWMRSYQKGLGDTRINKGKVLRDFAEAMARYGEPELFQGMLEEEEAQWVSPGDIRGHWAILTDKVAVVDKYILWGGRPGSEFINPADMRALTDLLAERVSMKAKQLKAAGELQKEIIGIQ